MYFKSLAALALSALVAGCASTTMTSVLNRQVRHRTFRKVMVSVRFASIEQEQPAEARMCQRLLTRLAATHPGFECVQSLSVFFPGNDYTDEQVSRMLADAGIDGVLIIEPVASGTREVNLPIITSVYAGHNTIAAAAIGGPSLHPWKKYAVSLLAEPGDTVVWYANGTTTGSQLAAWPEYIRSITGRTMQKLLEDKVFQ
jgi:hypothetical protein